MDLQMLDKLLSDERFMKLGSYSNKTKMFELVGKKRREEWHSAIVGWLLDANSSHLLNEFPLQRFLSLYYSKQEKAENATKIDYTEIYTTDYSKMECSLERQIKKERGFIDIFIKCDGLRIVIENKVEAKENMHTIGGQTKVYYDCIMKEFPAEKNLFVFLAADAKQKPDDREHYVCITYQELYDAVIAKCLENSEMNQADRVLLEEYAESLTTTLKNGEPMALIHKDVCKALYADYKELFENIRSGVDKENSDEHKIYMRYRSVFDEIYISADPKGKIIRKTEKLKGRELLLYLIDKGILKENDELYHEYPEVTLEVDVKKSEDGYYLLVGEKGENSPAIHNEPLDSFNKAANVALSYWRKQYKKTESISGTNANDYWLTKDGAKINDLLRSI